MCAATGRRPHAGDECVPPDRHLGGHVLHVEEEVQRAGRERVATLRQLEAGRAPMAHRDRSGAGQVDPAGGRLKARGDQAFKGTSLALSQPRLLRSSFIRDRAWEWSGREQST